MTDKKNAPPPPPKSTESKSSPPSGRMDRSIDAGKSQQGSIGRQDSIRKWDGIIGDSAPKLPTVNSAAPPPPPPQQGKGKK